MTAAAGSPLDVSVGLPGGWSEDLFGDRSDDGPVMPQPQTEEIRRLARIRGCVIFCGRLVQG